MVLKTQNFQPSTSYIGEIILDFLIGKCDLVVESYMVQQGFNCRNFHPPISFMFLLFFENAFSGKIYF